MNQLGNLVRLFRAPNDGAGAGGAAESGAGAETTAAGAATQVATAVAGEQAASAEATAITTATTTATQATVTPDEIEARSKAGTMAAYREIQAAQEAEQTAKVAEAARQQRTQRVSVDPEASALSVLDTRDELMDQVEEIIREQPAEVRESVRGHVRSELRRFKSLAEIEAVRTAGLHKTIADAALGKAYREGKLTSTASGSGLTREPVYSEPSAKVPAEFRREQEEVCKLLGVSLTEAELQSAWVNR